MAKKKAFPLRVNADIWEAMRRWSMTKYAALTRKWSTSCGTPCAKRGACAVQKKQDPKG